MVTYNIRKICYTKIVRYYNNVAKKYCNTYSFNLMNKNISQAYDDMLRIENGLMRRNPTIARWQNKGWQIQHSAMSFDSLSIYISAKTPESDNYDLYVLHAEGWRWGNPQC